MRFMLMVKGNEDTEAGVPPTAAQLQGMGALMEEMAEKGVLLAGDGLKPSSFGKRMKIAGGKVVSLTDGPFAETKELVAGFCIVDVPGWEEVEMWCEKFAAAQGEGECELRPLYEASDFIGENFSEADAAREDELRLKLQQSQQQQQ